MESILPDILLLCVAIAVSFRGKGGGFVTWGITSNGDSWSAHGLGAFLVGMALGIVTQQILYIPAFIAGWLIFTKPGDGWCLDLCEGFTWLKLLKATTRQLYILPCALLVLYVGSGSPWYLLGCLPLGSLYWLGGIAKRKYGSDPVELAEKATGIAGLMFYGLVGL